MKARIKATGNVVEVSLSHIIYDGDKKIIWYNTPQGSSFTEDELEFFDTEENFDYWTRLEHQYAGMAMQGLMTILPNIGGLEGRTPKDEIVDIAMETAHALVQKPKEKEERKWIQWR